MIGCKPAKMQLELTGKIHTKEGGDPVDRRRYQRFFGELIYLSHTRPNISFVVSVVSQYMHSPYEMHREVLNHILRYLK